MHLTLQRLETLAGGRPGGVGVEGWGHPLEDVVGGKGGVEEWDEKQSEGRPEWG